MASGTRGGDKVLVLRCCCMLLSLAGDQESEALVAVVVAVVRGGAVQVSLLQAAVSSTLGRTGKATFCPLGLDSPGGSRCNFGAAPASSS